MYVFLNPILFVAIPILILPRSHIASMDSNPGGQLMRDHMRRHPCPKEPLADEGMEFFDSGSESDDSDIWHGD